MHYVPTATAVLNNKMDLDMRVFVFTTACLTICQMHLHPQNRALSFLVTYLTRKAGNLSYQQAFVIFFYSVYTIHVV